MQTKHSTNHIDVRSIDLAAQLVTLHFRLRPEGPITLLVDEKGKKHFTAHFQTETEHDVFGPITIRQIINIAQGDPPTRASSPPMLVEVVDHMQTKDANRHTFLDIIKPRELGGQGIVPARTVFPVRDGWHASLPLDASPDLMRRFRAMVDQIT